MYHYLFTNDLRISVLDDSLQKAGHCFVTNTVPSSTVDKSANNNMMTLGFYFTLTESSNCAKAAEAGNTRAVVLNFIKKFQFPNMRTSTAYNDAKNDGIKLVPMRIIVKVLYTMNLLHGNLVAYLTKEEIKYFIFYNENVAKKKNPDIGQLITEILKYRKHGTIPTTVSTAERDHEWKHEDRQIREMLKVLQWSGCITEKEGKFVIDNDELSSRNKADVFDIITCDSFWEGTTIESYREYMDMPDYAVDFDGKIENIQMEREDPEERNKRLFKYWMKMQVKPEGDSDAGNPYSDVSIDQYVSNISNTPSPSVEGKSLFVTTDVGEVEFTIEVLDNSEKNNNTQRSAVRKYLQYVQMLDNDYEDIFNHELFGMHIKEKNDALSENHPHVCIGWSEMGDISQIDSKEKLSELYEEHYDKNSRGRGQDVGQIWRFLRDMKVGDYVIYAENSVFHIGRVESDYYYDETETEDQDSDYKSNRKVKWLKKNISRSVLSTNLHNSLKTAMSIWTLNDYKSAVLDLLRGTYAKDGDIEMASEYIEPVYNTKLTTKYERNRIVFGAPGTGKSFGLKTDCENLMKGTEGTYERVTFHPDYTYSQFVGTYKPVMDADGTSIRYDFVPGPFMRVYVEAIKSGRTDAPQPHLLLIEEINRAKVSAVFGDVFQLLDRDDDGVSEYEIQASEDIRRYLAKELGGVPDNYKKIRIPNNMFIWATMNSADQGVFPMDTAFKRRWNFEYLGINESEEEIIGIGKIALPGEPEAVEWNAVRRAINDRMASEYRINEDKLMGPFFLAKKVIASDENGMIIDPEKFMEAFKSKVIMYLYEDAVKQRKHDFFNGCDSSKYSSVCDAFDEKGIAIFGSSVKNTVYNK